MLSPLGYITPYQEADFSPIQRGLESIQQMRIEKARRAQAQQQFDAEQAQRAAIAGQQNQLARDKMGLDASQFDARQGQDARQHAERLDFDRQGRVDKTLEDFTGAAQEGNAPALEAMQPRMRSNGLSMEGVDEQVPSAPVPTPLPGMPLQLRRPEMGASATPTAQAQQAPAQKPQLPGMALPMLRDPSQSFGAPKQAPQRLPGGIGGLVAPDAQPEAPKALQPGPTSVPTGKVRIMRGGQDMGQVDLGGIIDQNAANSADSAQAWAGSPKDDAQVAAAEEKMVQALLAAGIGREKALSMAAAAANGFRNRIAAGQRAEQMSGRAERTAQHAVDKDSHMAYRAEIEKLEGSTNVRAMNDGLAMADDIISASSSANPVEQLRSKTSFFKSAIKGQLSDRDTAMLETAQGAYGSFLERFNRWLDQPQLDPEFLRNIKGNMESVKEALLARREDIAEDAYYRIIDNPGIAPQLREDYANQAAARVLGVRPQMGKAAQPGAGAGSMQPRNGGTSSSAYSAPGGGSVDNLGVTDGGKSSRYNADEDAAALLRGE